MKKLSILCFLLMPFCGFAQTKEAHAIKIFLEDAETGKNINDAKVTLEGFEIPAITAKYNPEIKAYYFDEIPKGYNTVMAYHEKYNEKGFQNTEGLPKKLKLKLYTHYRVRIPDSLNYYKGGYYEGAYLKEDPYKLHVFFNDTISNSSVKCQDISNGYLCSVRQYFSKNYPELLLVKTGSISLDPVFERKDKEKFKRFNDPIIKRLAEDKNIITLDGILMITKTKRRAYFDEQGKPIYLSKYIKYSGDAIFSIDYIRKKKKGLLKNNIYKLTDKDIDSISVSDQIKIKNGELMRSFYLGDTIKALRFEMFYDTRSMAGTVEIGYSHRDFNYWFISNNLGTYDLQGDKTQKGWRYYQIGYYWKDIKAFKKKNKLIEAVNISNLSPTEQIKQIKQIKQTEDNRHRCYYNFSVYRLKNSIASPFGTMDLIEHYNLSKNKIHQQIN